MVTSQKSKKSANTNKADNSNSFKRETLKGTRFDKITQEGEVFYAMGDAIIAKVTPTHSEQQIEATLTTIDWSLVIPIIAAVSINVTKNLEQIRKEEKNINNKETKTTKIN